MKWIFLFLFRCSFSFSNSKNCGRIKRKRKLKFRLSFSYIHGPDETEFSKFPLRLLSIPAVFVSVVSSFFTLMRRMEIEIDVPSDATVYYLLHCVHFKRPLFQIQRPSVSLHHCYSCLLTHYSSFGTWIANSPNSGELYRALPIELSLEFEKQSIPSFGAPLNIKIHAP